MIISQGSIFLIYIIAGGVIGLVFDIFRALRKSIKTPNIVTYIEDVLFWVIVGFIIIATTLKFNYGELRFYIFIGLLLGVVSYFLTLSKIIVKFTSLAISLFVKILCETKKATMKIFGKPIKFIIINLRKFPLKIKQKKKNKNMSKIV